MSLAQLQNRAKSLVSTSVLDPAVLTLQIVPARLGRFSHGNDLDLPRICTCMDQTDLLHPSSSLCILCISMHLCKNPVHWKCFYNVLAMFKLHHGQFISMGGEERDCKLLYFENKPFCLHSLILRTKDFRVNLGAVADFSQQLVRCQLGEKSCFFFFLKGRLD